MKTTEQIQIKPAQWGTICSGTLRDVDLLPAFTTELEYQLVRNGEYFSRPENFQERDRLNNLVGEAQDCFAENGEDIDESKRDVVDELINETLPDALCRFAPAYGYFGAHCGDGADFGYWAPDIEDLKEQLEFVSSKEQENPDSDFRGEWLHINDHGNCALYVRGEDGKDTELWSLV
jgi:hypothetical protein